MAVSTVRMSGLDRVLKNLNAEIRKLTTASKVGMRQAALLVKGRAQRKTPVDTGNLKGSAYIEVYQTLYGPGAEIGFTASYAPFVHEIDKNYRSPGAGWKFLERAVAESHKEILDILARTAKLD